MSGQLIVKNNDGTYFINSPVVFSCGCGGISSIVNGILSSAGAPGVPIVLTSSNVLAQGFVKWSGLKEAEPSLKKGRHAVLYNPRTTKFVNLLAKDNKNLLANVYTVARGM